MRILPISQPIKKVGKMMLPTIAATAMLTACNAPNLITTVKDVNKIVLKSVMIT